MLPLSGFCALTFLSESDQICIKIFNKRYSCRLDILVNNAAVMEYPVTATKDEIDLTYQTNHFGPFLLTSLLQGIGL